MRSHLDAAMDLQSDLVDGRLAHAREMAGWLARHDTRFDPDQPRDGELQRAAATVEVAKDVPSAAAGIGRLGRACSSCHEARRARADRLLDPTPAPADQPTLEAQMGRHAWAARRLWEGVIVPSELAWTDGSRVIATSTIDLTRTTNAKPNADVAELAERMRSLSLRATDTADHDARAVLYGEMLVVCANCHSIVRTNPVSRAP